jgi:hypothetical protein
MWQWSLCRAVPFGVSLPFRRLCFSASRHYLTGLVFLEDGRKTAVSTFCPAVLPLDKISGNFFVEKMSRLK